MRDIIQILSEKKSHGFYNTPLLKILNGLWWPLPPFCLLKNRRRHVVSVISSGSIILLEITLDKNLKINFRKPRPFKFCGFFKKIEYKNFSTFLYSIFKPGGKEIVYFLYIKTVLAPHQT